MIPDDDASLVDLFQRLAIPARSEADAKRYAASPISFSQSYRLARDSNGSPALLIRVPDDPATSSVPIRLRHLYVMHNVDCVIYRNGDTESGRFSVLSCIEADSTTEVYFLCVLEALLPALGESPDTLTVNGAVDRLVELFQALRNPTTKRTQGLWAELLLLAECRDPGELIDAWHTVPHDLYDFGKGDQRLEVKSTLEESRVHHFSLAQLQPPDGTNLLIVSVMVRRVGGGTSILELVDELRYRLSESPHHLLRLYRLVAMTLGDRWRDSSSEMFDRAAARHSLAFFQASAVPMVNPDLPPGVSNVRFVSDLSGQTPCPSREVRALGGLMASAVPR